MDRSDTATKTTLFTLFNHTFTGDQEKDAYRSLGVQNIVSPPPAIQACWVKIPPDLADITGHLEPVLEWLRTIPNPGDYILTQGDSGATFMIVNECFTLGLIPVYSTTLRNAKEQPGENGQIDIIHRFSHVCFRGYKL